MTIKAKESKARAKNNGFCFHPRKQNWGNVTKIMQNKKKRLLTNFVFITEQKMRKTRKSGEGNCGY